MEFARIGTSSFIAMGLTALLGIALPIAVVLIWKIRKKERMTTILIGAATFLLFALVLEKPIQNAIIFPVQMGLPDHAVSRFINARPLLWAFLAGLFPGVFEETGRLVAFTTVLRKRKNRETSISHGLGHGCFEAMFLIGVTYIEYIALGIMINTGTFGSIISQAAAQAPDAVGQLYTIADQLASFSFGSMAIALVERVFAVLFHVGASIMVFYACRDKKRFWLYPLAIILHTALDFIAALTMVNLFNPSPVVLEVIVGVFGILTFLGAYFLLYRKDQPKADDKELV